MPIFGDGTVFTDAILPDSIKQPHSQPPDEEAAKAKALINFLMQDRLFLALYRSNDPKMRALAMEKLNRAHHRAYGDVPTANADACTQDVTPTSSRHWPPLHGGK